MHDVSPLTPAAKKLLDKSLEIEMMDDVSLSNELAVSIHTIRTEFKQAFEITGTHSRAQLLIRSLKQGWVSLPQAPPRRAIVAKQTALASRATIATIWCIDGHVAYR